ncbi:hypothetical protein Tco_0732347 [Tanacetum coccineum]
MVHSRFRSSGLSYLGDVSKVAVKPADLYLVSYVVQAMIGNEEEVEAFGDLRSSLSSEHHKLLNEVEEEVEWRMRGPKEF